MCLSVSYPYQHYETGVLEKIVKTKIFVTFIKRFVAKAKVKATFLSSFTRHGDDCHTNEYKTDKRVKDKIKARKKRFKNVSPRNLSDEKQKSRKKEGIRQQLSQKHVAKEM